MTKVFWLLLLLRFMAPKKRTLKRYADELPELAHLPRKQLLQLLTRLKDGSCDLDNLGTSTDYYDSSFHYHFDQCCCSDEFRLITALAKTQKLVYDAFVIERLHLLLKTTCTRVDNTRNFEKSVLSGALNDIVSSLKNNCRPCCLVGTAQNVGDAVLSTGMKYEC